MSSRASLHPPTPPGRHSPLNWAAGVTWGAVAAWPALELLNERLAWTPTVALGFAAMLVMLVLMLLRAHLQRVGSAPAAAWCVLLQMPMALLALAALPYVTQAILLVVLAGQLAAYFSARATLVMLLVANGIAAGLFVLRMPVPAATITMLSFIGFQMFAVLVTGYAFRAEAARDAALAANAELRAAQRLLADSARGDERLRLARELHDVAGHKLTALKLQLELALRRADPELAAQLRSLHGLADELLQEVRGVVGAMRQHEGIDLPRALEALAQALPPGLVVLDVDPALRVPGVQQAEALLRCAQEGVTNAVRHGGANRICILLHAGEGGLELRVEDNGRGLRQGRPGHGLKGLEERLGLVAGRLELRRREGGGTCLRAWLPA